MDARVAIRTDASRAIGSGHVMRCLVLADALAGAGCDIVFLCRALDGHLAERISARGHRVALLEGQTHSPRAAAPPHAHWLPVSQQADAAQCREALEGICPDWIIVDHYALDATWQDALRPHCKRMMAIDDLADRPHRVHLLLDQNLGRDSRDYAPFVPDNCRRIVGPRYALLAPQFAELRQRSLSGRSQAKLSRLLITMGGVDKDDVTGGILKTLAARTPPGLDHIDVVLGSTAPHLRCVDALLGQLPVAASLHIDTPRMAELMAAADAAIGAGGSTSWERCCLGLPTLMACLAENQRQVVGALCEAGAALDLGDAPAPGFAQRLEQALKQLENPRTLRDMSVAAAEICDGGGTRRVLAEMKRLP